LPHIIFYWHSAELIAARSHGHLADVNRQRSCGVPGIVSLTDGYSIR
jgi:hypothetical protein